MNALSFCWVVWQGFLKTFKLCRCFVMFVQWQHIDNCWEKWVCLSLISTLFVLSFYRNCSPEFGSAQGFFSLRIFPLILSMLHGALWRWVVGQGGLLGFHLWLANLCKMPLNSTLYNVHKSWFYCQLLAPQKTKCMSTMYWLKANLQLYLQPVGECSTVNCRKYSSAAVLLRNLWPDVYHRAADHNKVRPTPLTRPSDTLAVRGSASLSPLLTGTPADSLRSSRFLAGDAGPAQPLWWLSVQWAALIN